MTLWHHPQNKNSKYTECFISGSQDLFLAPSSPRINYTECSKLRCSSAASPKAAIRAKNPGHLEFTPICPLSSSSQRASGLFAQIMPPRIHSAKLTLSCPLFAADFDPRNNGRLLVGGGGGEGRTGVGNKIVRASAPCSGSEYADCFLF